MHQKGLKILTLEAPDSQMVNIEDAGIVLKKSNPSAGIPNIVIENLKVLTFNAGEPGKKDTGKNMSIVRYEGVDAPILPKASAIDTWAMGNQVMDSSGSISKSQGNLISPSTKVPAALKSSNGTVFERSKPQYETANKIVQVTSLGVKNDGSGDQSALINRFLNLYKGSVVYFPAGVYAVADTIFVPSGTKMVGEGWSQIMGYGPSFSDETNPRPVVKLVYDIIPLDSVLINLGSVNLVTLVSWRCQVSLIQSKLKNIQFTSADTIRLPLHRQG
jgi:hypothetical protein